MEYVVCLKAAAVEVSWCESHNIARYLGHKSVLQIQKKADALQPSHFIFNLPVRFVSWFTYFDII